MAKTEGAGEKIRLPENREDIKLSMKMKDMKIISSTNLLVTPLVHSIPRRHDGDVIHVDHPLGHIKAHLNINSYSLNYIMRESPTVKWFVCILQGRLPSFPPGKSPERRG